MHAQTYTYVCVHVYILISGVFLNRSYLTAINIQIVLEPKICVRAEATLAPAERMAHDSTFDVGRRGEQPRPNDQGGRSLA